MSQWSAPVSVFRAKGFQDTVFDCANTCFQREGGLSFIEEKVQSVYHMCEWMKENENEGTRSLMKEKGLRGEQRKRDLR